MRLYHWDFFYLKYDPETGSAYTFYPDESSSGCEPGPDDAFHAGRLGITTGEHRLLHELAHHLIGTRYYHLSTGSPVIWRDAHGIPQEPRESELEEWMATALSYIACGRSCEDYGALLDLSRECDPMEMAKTLRWLLDAPDGVEVVVPERNLVTAP